jgi:hypothetical protein
MWSRLVRMKTFRSGANQRESSGHLIGGCATPLAAMASGLNRREAEPTCRPVQGDVIRRNRAVAVRNG